FENGYTFTTRPRRLDDYAAMCHYQQTAPESTFTQRLICSRATEHGRISLSASRLIVTANGKRDEHLLANAGEIRVVLQQHFDIALSTQDVQTMFNSIGMELDS
ncbi:MAG: arylamine N-acetyltransferase, partial [Anaerolineae bacterium]|nr:arylamine N-acetyltransferase [Anaerolineae bacterium]